MSGLFLYLYRLLKRNSLLPWLILGSMWIPILFFALQIKTNEDITQVLPGAKGGKQYQEVIKRAALLERLVIGISLTDTAVTSPEQLTEFATTFAEALDTNKVIKNNVRHIRHKLPDDLMQVAYQNFHRYLPYYLTDADYDTLARAISKEHIRASLQKNYAILMSPMGMVVKDQLQSDPLHFTTLALAKLKGLQMNDAYKLYDGYIMSKDQRRLLIMLTPRYPPNDAEHNVVLINELDAIIKKSIADTKHQIQVSYFGATAVAVANAAQVKFDIWLTATISVISIFVLLWWYFRKKSLPFILVLPILFGVSFAVACIYLYKGNISVIALGGGVVIIGIAIDYALHVFTHFKHTKSIETVIKDLTAPLLLGNISTVAAFLSLYFVQSAVLFDFGLFAGLSLVGAILFTLVFLPHFFTNFPTATNDDTLGMKKFSRFFSAPKALRKCGYLLIIAASCLFYYFSTRVKFEEDLNALNFMTPELRASERIINAGSENGTLRTIYLLSNGSDLNDALTQASKAMPTIGQLKREGLALQYSGVNDLLPTNEVLQYRIQKWRNFWNPTRVAELERNLSELASQAGFKAEAYRPFLYWVSNDFPIANVDTMLHLQRLFLQDFIYKDHSNGRTVVMSGLTIPSQHSLLVNEKLSGISNQFVLDKQFLIKKFVEIVKQDFNQILLTSSLLVFLILLIFYGRIELALITFLPMLLSWLWILGLMGLFDLRFNIVNIIISTFVFGLGDDFSIFMTDGLLGEYKDGTRNLPSYKISILLAATTTLLGIGVLIFAQHPALKSIAMISVIGIVCVLFFSSVFIPMMFRALITNRVGKGQAPATLFSIITSALFYLCACMSAVALSVIAFVLFGLLRLNNIKVRLAFRYLMMYVARMLLSVTFFIEKDFRYSQEEILAKPALVLVNHQSLLDVLILLAYSPRLLILGDNWLSKLPMPNAILCVTHFLKLSIKTSDDLEEIEKVVAQGYSIGMLSSNSHAANFKKIAFPENAYLLAERFKLDIVPMLIYGSGECMPIGDGLLGSGVVAVKVLEKISFSNFNSTSLEVFSNSVEEKFQTAYEILRLSHQNLAFYKNKIVQKFIYKTPQLEWYTKIKLRLEKNYEVLHALIPKEGRIYDIGCGYGYFATMMAFMSNARKITGLDYDEDKIRIASHANQDLPHLNFTATDANAFEYEPAEAIIISDVLHYMAIEQQKLLIKKCIEALRKDGVLLIRDADNSMQKRHRGTKISEFFSVKLFKFNKSVNQELHFFSSQEILGYLQTFDVTAKVIDRTKFNSNVIYYVIKN